MISDECDGSGAERFDDQLAWNQFTQVERAVREICCAVSEVAQS